MGRLPKPQRVDGQNSSDEDRCLLEVQPRNLHGG